MRGIIKGFGGSWGSGLAILIIEDSHGECHRIPCDNAPTVRALSYLFPNVIGANHSVNVNAIMNKQIEYDIDDIGVLRWIASA